MLIYWRVDFVIFGGANWNIIHNLCSIGDHHIPSGHVTTFSTLHLYDTSMRSMIPMSSPWRWVSKVSGSSNWFQIRNGYIRPSWEPTPRDRHRGYTLVMSTLNLNMAIYSGFSIVVLGYQRVSLLSCDFMVVPYGGWKKSADQHLGKLKTYK